MKINNAIVAVHMGRNNIIATVTDISGSYTLFQRTGGQVCKAKRDRDSATTVNNTIVELAAFLAKNKIVNVTLHTVFANETANAGNNFNPLNTVVRRILRSNGIEIIEEIDKTPIPTDRVKPRYGRRGRRV